MYVIGSLDKGGAEIHLLRVLPDLKNKYGWEPTIYCLGNPGSLADQFINNKICVISPPILTDGEKHNIFYRTFRISLAAFKLWYYLIMTNQQIVHFFLPQSYLVGLPIALFAGRTRLIVSRRSLNKYQNKIKGSRAIESIYHKFLTVGVGNSNAVIKELLDEKLPIKKLRLLYNGINRNNQKNYNYKAVRSKYYIPIKSVVFIIVANLIPYKGHDFLLKSFSLINDSLPQDWRLVIVGEDRGILNKLKSLSIQLGLENNLLWLGVIDDTREILSASDIGVLSSMEEGFSNSILEAMAAGLPMVVTDVGGNSEAVVNEQTGYVVPYNDTKLMSESLLKLALDSELRVKMGTLGKERVEKHFSLDKCVHKYHLLYTAVINNMPLPRLDTPEQYLD